MGDVGHILARHYTSTETTLGGRPVGQQGDERAWTHPRIVGPMQGVQASMSGVGAPSYADCTPPSRRPADSRKQDCKGPSPLPQTFKHTGSPNHHSSVQHLPGRLLAAPTAWCGRRVGLHLKHNSAFMAVQHGCAQHMCFAERTRGQLRALVLARAPHQREALPLNRQLRAHHTVGIAELSSRADSREEPLG